MEITLDTLEISASTDITSIANQRVRSSSSIVRPLRAVSARPKPRGGATITWIIEVNRQHADQAAAESYRSGLAAAVATAMTHSDSAGPLSIEGRGDYVDAVIDDVDIQNHGLTSKVVWQLTSSTTTAAP